MAIAGTRQEQKGPLAGRGSEGTALKRYLVFLFVFFFQKCAISSLEHFNHSGGMLVDTHGILRSWNTGPLVVLTSLKCVPPFISLPLNSPADRGCLGFFFLIQLEIYYGLSNPYPSDKTQSPCPC